MNRTTRYIARLDELVVQEVGDELLIYDRRTDVAHSLSATAAQVWRGCENGAPLSDLIRGIGKNPGSEDPEGLVLAALGELQEKGLLESPGSDGIGISRRQAMGRMAKIGAAAAAAPLVVSAVVTSPAMAGSVASNTDGTPCVSANTCSSPLCTAGTNGAHVVLATGAKYCATSSTCVAGGTGPTGSNACVAADCCSKLCTGNGSNNVCL